MKTQPAQTRPTAQAFTLVDLAAVLSVAFLLIAIVLPSLKIDWQRNQSKQCLYNLRELNLASLAYAGANRDACVPNAGGGLPNWSWCSGILNWEVDSQNTNTDLLRSSLLYPYLGGDATPFDCPANVFLSPAQVAVGYKSRVRGYSMNSLFGGADYLNPNYRHFLKTSDAPNPSALYLFVEEHPDSMNDSSFAVGEIGSSKDAGSFMDAPANYHAACAGFSFADGHCEMHRWVDSRESGTPGAGLAGLPVCYNSYASPRDAKPYTDIHWLWNHSSVLIKP